MTSDLLRVALQGSTLAFWVSDMLKQCQICQMIYPPVCRPEKQGFCMREERTGQWGRGELRAELVGVEPVESMQKHKYSGPPLVAKCKKSSKEDCTKGSG